MTRAVEVLGLGNSLVDIIALTADDYLVAQKMVKGAMTLIDEPRAESLYAARVAPTIVSGGSAANTIVGVGSFGLKGAYIDRFVVNLFGGEGALNSIGTDYNNDRAVDIVVTGAAGPSRAAIFENPREGRFVEKQPWSSPMYAAKGIAILDFDHDGWMDIAFTHFGQIGITLWHNNHGQNFE